MPHCVKSGPLVCWAWNHDDVVRSNLETGPKTPPSVIDAIRDGINDKNTFTWTSGGIQITVCGKMLRSRAKLKDEVITCVECLAITGETR